MTIENSEFLSLVPHDIVWYNDKMWVVFARSIQDGKSVMLARLSESHAGLDIETIVPTKENCRFAAKDELPKETYIKITSQFCLYEVTALYF